MDRDNQLYILYEQLAGDFGVLPAFFFPDPCEECGEKEAQCTFCKRAAYKFVETERMEVYVCDRHESIVVEETQGAERSRFDGSEVVMYCPTPDCTCDPWQ